MKKLLYTALIALFSPTMPLGAQQIFRSEIDCYTKRADAQSRERVEAENITPFTPNKMEMVDGFAMLSFEFDQPYVWSDQNVYLHLESAKSAYTLYINGVEVAAIEDSFSPADFEISSYLRQGANTISTLMRSSSMPQIESALEPTKRKPFEGSYLSTQHKLKVRDYIISFTPHPFEANCAELRVQLIVENSYNYPEMIEVGFDIYDPEHKLLEFNQREAQIAGKSRDTITFAHNIYGVDRFRYGAASPKLYDVMLYTKRENIIRDYIPVRIGYRALSYMAGEIYNFDKPIELRVKPYAAQGTKQQARTELAQLKKGGTSAIQTRYTQPHWLYDLCDEMGIYVIEQPNFNPSPEQTSRKVGGTPANDPKLRGEYMRRIKASYYATRNRTSVVAYALSSGGGNGYNLYKGYELFKSLESTRPIINQSAAGEWNSDDIILK